MIFLVLAIGRVFKRPPDYDQLWRSQQQAETMQSASLKVNYAKLYDVGELAKSGKLSFQKLVSSDWKQKAEEYLFHYEFGRKVYPCGWQVMAKMPWL